VQGRPDAARPHLTRYVLEVPRADTLADWPDERIWPELDARLNADGEPPIARGPLVERDMLGLLDGGAANDFGYDLRLARLQELMTSPAAEPRWFAYAGVD
jgi:hypothetical protein